MNQNALSVTLFLLTSALLLGVEAVKTQGRPRYSFAIGAGFFVLVGIFWTPLAEAFPVVARQIVSITLTPSSWFILVLTLFLLLRQSWSKKPDTAHDNNQYEDQNMYFDETNEQIASAKSRIDALTVSAIDLQKNHEVLTASMSEIKTLSHALRDQSNGHGAKIDSHHDSINALVNTVARLNERNRAIANREMISEIEGQINALYQGLYYANAAEIQNIDWQLWKLRETQWRVAIRSWSERGSFYLKKDIWSQIKSVPTESYLEEFSFSDRDFPDSETIHRYKTFCLMVRRFNEIKDEVDSAVYNTAFG